MNKRAYISIAIAVICIIAIGIIYLLRQGGFAADSGHMGLVIHTGDTTPTPTQAQPLPLEPVQTIIYYGVHIVGEVNNPGVFFLPQGSRVVDVLALAGGETAYANILRVNLALIIRDEMQIIIPSVYDTDIEVFVFADDTNASPTSGLININTASSELLQTLPGIGPARANAIISHRENHGNFSSIEGLLQVSGIGPAILSGIRDFITV